MRLSRYDISTLHGMVDQNLLLCAAMGEIAHLASGIAKRRAINTGKAGDRIAEIAREALRGNFDDVIAARARVMQLEADRRAKASWETRPERLREYQYPVVKPLVEPEAQLQHSCSASERSSVPSPS